MSVISVEPAELLTFTLSKGNQSTAAIKIKNTSGGKIAFKVRLESPLYLVYEVPACRSNVQSQSDISCALARGLSAREGLQW
jgi:hypothetical protein